MTSPIQNRKLDSSERNAHREFQPARGIGGCFLYWPLPKGEGAEHEVKGRVRGEEKASLHPSPAAHLSMGVTLSLRERPVQKTASDSRTGSNPLSAWRMDCARSHLEMGPRLQMGRS